jgi:hypothetical protein
MVNSCAVCGCCTRTDIVREHLEDTLRICDVSAKGLYNYNEIKNLFKIADILLLEVKIFQELYGHDMKNR